MDDRTMLELAAKAAGYERYVSSNDATGRVMIWCDGQIVEFKALTDDGDALRLAVRCAQLFGFYRFMRAWLIAMATEQGDIADPYAATRRAIVRAAASIGSTLPTGAEE